MQVDKAAEEVNNNELSLSVSQEEGETPTLTTINPAKTITVGGPPILLASGTAGLGPPEIYSEKNPKSGTNTDENQHGVLTVHTSIVTSTESSCVSPPRLTEVKLEPASPPASPPSLPLAASPTLDVESYDGRSTPSPVIVCEPERKSPEEHKLFQPLDQGLSDSLGYYEYDSSDRLEVECGPNKAILIIDKLCQGSKGKCIEFMGNMLTPNEFQSVSGRETAKDWKRSIRYRGKSLKTLMARGVLKAHPLLCECHRCKSGLHKRKHEKKSPSSTDAKRSSMDMSTDNSYATQYSSSQNGPEAKRSRSASPLDMYDVEQRRLFEMANSPEPKNIENFQRSMKSEDSRAESPDEKSLTDESNETAPSTSTHNHVLRNLHYTITKPLGKHRKQTAPKQAVPHIALTSFPSHSTFKTHTVMRPRLHNTSQSLTVPLGPASEGSATIKRAKSLFTPTSKTPSHVRMIELTRPAQSSTDKAPTNGDDLSYRQSASSTSDTVFLPSEMTTWSVDDVAEFVQSLKGCEEYSQVFREQAIDGEILPVLTEEHLLNNMGLKLGPALKIKINVAKRLGYHIIDNTLQ